MKKLIVLSCLLSAYTLSFSQTAKRNLRPGDIYKLQSIGNPQTSPDGQWIAYTVSTIDSAKDKRNSDIWMVSWDGKQTIQLTNSTEGESDPQWSPDSKYLSFTSSRQGGTNQIWLLDRRGGEAIKLTNVKGGLADYSWSPDGKKIALIVMDEKDTAKNKPPQPYVINKFHFKQDVSGYIYDSLRTHLYLFDVASKKTEPLTSGIYNETDAQWSPDGSKIAFVSNHTEEPDRNSNSDIWIVDAKTGASPRQFTTWAGSDNNPQWSPDGKSIAYTRSTGNGNFLMYDEPILCVADVATGTPQLLSKALDRPVYNPRWSKDGKSVAVLVADDCQRYIASYEVSSSQMTKIAGGDRSFSDLELHPNGSWVATMAEPQLPPEIYAIENNNTRRLTTLQNKFTDSLSFATVEKFTSKSKDGNMVSGLLFLPPNAPKQHLPLILYIHGGPVGQDEFGFDLYRQMLAARGYAVAAVNYRGSAGRGLAYTKAIYADWGHKEVLDILGAADYLVAKGIADPNRMGIGGWSYGGILTDYTIASDTRFKAASSGAGSALQLALYGVDQYTLQYENELGQPWKNNNYQKYLKLSYPFLHADRIKTPTQFMAGEKDFNVPSMGSEQMYQALRSQGVPTELLIYPGQFHGFTQPSFIKDRFERYWQWFDKYLKNGNM